MERLKEDIIEKIILKCKTLTPVHIGSGKEIDPLEYVIDDKKKLYIINLDDVLNVASDNDKNKIITYSEKKEIGNLRYLIKKTAIENIDKIEKIRVVDVSDEFYNIYKEEIEKSLINNTLSIKLNMASNNKPIIPGSSIKGAIRTFVLAGRFNYIDDKTKKELINNDLIESKLLNATRYDNNHKEKKDIPKDPFKALKISDVELPANSTKIYEVRNKNSSGQSKGGIPIYIEAIKPDIEFNIEINIAKYYFQENYIGFKDAFASKEKIKSLLNYIAEKVINKKNNEHERLKNYKSLTDADKQKLNSIYNNINDSKGNLLRVGFGSGFDFVTVEGYRIDKKWGKSKNLTSDLMPLGFISLNMAE